MGKESKLLKVETRASVEKFLKTFKRELIELGVPVAELFLFGSFARNQQTAHSDIDVCILIDGNNDNLEAQHLRIMQHVFHTKRDIDVVSYCKAGFKKNTTSPLIHEIKKSGVKL